MVKHLNKVLEEHRTAVRNIRRDGNDAIKKAMKDKKISEDEERGSLEQLQKITDDEIKKMEEMFKGEGKGSDAGLKPFFSALQCSEPGEIPGFAAPLCRPRLLPLESWMSECVYNPACPALFTPPARTTVPMPVPSWSPSKMGAPLELKAIRIIP